METRIFFTPNLYIFSKNESKKPWYRKNETDERNQKARKAYEALMTVTLRKPTSPEYKNFSNEVKRRAKQHDENFTYGEEEVSYHTVVFLPVIDDVIRDVQNNLDIKICQKHLRPKRSLYYVGFIIK